jgi:NAD(P)-dependent dehydrogenase (short-subunit alcohol dehydrogenase family)
MTVFRPKLLAGRAVALGSAHDAVRDGLLELGARVEILDGALHAVAAEGRVGEWARARSPLDAVIYDAAPSFGDGGQRGLQAASAQAWEAIREIVNGELIPRERRGKVVLIAPSSGAGAFAQAARAALENLARTLSVEWARYGITVTMIAPGPATTPAQLAELACFLVSPAGDYFSGCRFSLAAGETAV